MIFFSSLYKSGEITSLIPFYVKEKKNSIAEFDLMQNITSFFQKDIFTDLYK